MSDAGSSEEPRTDQRDADRGGDLKSTFDFIVVGSGGGSMCAALVMRALGKSCLILEKTPFIGGTTAKSGGIIWVPNNRFMKMAGITDSREQALTYLDDLIGDDPTALGATRERRIKYVDESPRMIDFLVAQGIALSRAESWPDYYDERPGGSVKGRTVIALPFNTKELGAWKSRLREGFLQLPATLPDILQLPSMRRSWKSKLIVAKVALRIIAQKLTGAHYVSAGMALQGRMLQAALRAGVDFRTEAAVKSLVVENNRVAGVIAEIDGKPVRFGAKLGVLINAGGFSRNARMREKYMPFLPTADWTNTAEGDTGEMIEEMMRLGAPVSQMEEFVGNQTTPAPGFEKLLVKPPIQSVTAKPHAILVDQSGVRYMNEGGSYMAYCKGMVERNEASPAIPSWAIFDRQYLEKYMIANTMPGLNKPKAWTEQNYLKQADSIEGLARLLGMDAAILKSTVDRFNGFVDKGRDEDFHRGERAYDNWIGLGDPYHSPSPSLGRIDKAPFCAVQVLPGDVGTFGGVVTDVYGRVLTEDGAPIAGLYATGVSTASVMGRIYPGAGCSIGPSFTWGYIAARHAAGLEGATEDTEGANVIPFVAAERANFSAA